MRISPSAHSILYFVVAMSVSLIWANGALSDSRRCTDQGEYHTRLVDNSFRWTPGLRLGDSSISIGASGGTQASGVLYVVPWGAYHGSFSDDSRIACWHVGMHVADHGVTFATVHGRNQDLVELLYFPRNQNIVHRGFDRARRGDLDVHGVEDRYARIGFQNGKRENHYRYDQDCGRDQWRANPCDPITTTILSVKLNEFDPR